MQTANAQLDISPFADTISAMQSILARSQVIIPNLETPYSRFPNTDHSTIILEGQSVIDVIAKRQQQLDTVSHEILGLEAVMDVVKNLHQQLIEKKDKITHSMNLHKGLVSPLSRVPNELLAQIFHHCFPDTNPKTNCFWSPSRLKVPMRLVGICRRWREVATGTPSLWCRLHIEVDDEDWRRAAFCYNSWLKWSRGLPLSLAVKCFNANHSATLRRLLHPYLNHISSLSILLLSNAEKLELLLTDLPALEELTIFFNYYVTLVAILPLLPPMRKFTIILPMLSTHWLNCLGSNWTHLTDVGISTAIYLGSVINLLRRCPNLSSLTMRGSFHYPESTSTPLTHPKIQSLRIDHRDSSIELLCELIGAVSLPNLRFLELCSDRRASGRQAHDMHDMLLKLIERSKCPLQSLMFGRQAEVVDELRAAYITLIPSLEIGIVEEEYFKSSVGTLGSRSIDITSFYCAQ